MFSALPKPLRRVAQGAAIASLGYCSYKVVSAVREITHHPTSDYARVLGGDNAYYSEDDPRYARYFKNRDNLLIYWHCLTPLLNNAGAQAVVIIVHGYGEHSTRYVHVASELAKSGICVFSMDHHGHGMSQGTRNYFKFEELVRDVLTLRAKVAKMPHLQGKPVFLLGHSMGGLISAHIAAREQSSSLFAGIILSSPYLKVGKGNPDTPDPLIVVSRALATIVPKLELFDGVMASLAAIVTEDAATVENYRRDPLIYHGGVKVAPGLQLYDAQKALERLASQVTLPVLAWHSVRDMHADVEGTQSFMHAISSKDKDCEIFTSGRHELLNEISTWRGLVNKCAQWIQQHS